MRISTGLLTIFFCRKSSRCSAASLIIGGAARLAELVARRDSLSKELWDVGRSLRSGKSLARDDRIALEEKQVQLKQQDKLVVRQIKQLCS